MILCLTLNPCLDKTLTAPAWQPGNNVRGQTVREVVGGKGNNVARALKRLGRLARPVTFLGGPIGEYCATLLREADGLDPIIAPTAAHTRIILTVRAEGVASTAFFDPDPAITWAEATDFLERVEALLKAGGIEAVTLSGSSPATATHDVFSEVIGVARAQRVPAYLDTYGPALDAIWGFWPETMSLNRREAGLYLKKDHPSDAELLGLLRRWAGHGVKAAVISSGPDPVLSIMEGRPYRAIPPEIEPVNPIGSGDCLLAGLVDARLRGLGAEETLRHAIGCAVDNAVVWDAGAIEVETANRYAQEVVLEPL